MPLAGDVTAADFPERAVGTAVGAFGGLHILVNNAGGSWGVWVSGMVAGQQPVPAHYVRVPYRHHRTCTLLVPLLPATNLALRRLTVSGSVTFPLCGYPAPMLHVGWRTTQHSTIQHHTSVPAHQHGVRVKREETV